MKYHHVHVIEPLNVTGGTPDPSSTAPPSGTGPWSVGATSAATAPAPCICNDGSDPNCFICTIDESLRTAFNLPNPQCCTDLSANATIDVTMWREFLYRPCCGDGCNGCPGFRETFVGSGSVLGPGGTDGSVSGTWTVSVAEGGCADGYPQSYSGSWSALSCFPWIDLGSEAINWFGVGNWPQVIYARGSATCTQFTISWHARTIPTGENCQTGGSGANYVEQKVYMNVRISPARTGNCCQSF